MARSSVGLVATTAAASASRVTGMPKAMPVAEKARLTPSSSPSAARSEARSTSTSGAVRSNAPAGLAPDPAHPHQLAEPSRGDAHGEAAEEVAEVGEVSERQAEVLGKHVPAQAAEQVVGERQRQQDADLPELKLGDLGAGFFPAGAGGKRREPGKDEDANSPATTSVSRRRRFCALGAWGKGSVLDIAICRRISGLLRR